MSTIIVTASEAASSLKMWTEIATLAGVVTAPVAIIIALAQYISTNRASARAHMHAVFRDYLAFRATVPKGNEHHVIGYRYYAMEEVHFWVMSQKWLDEGERKAWLETIEHHIAPDKGKEGHRYFAENPKIFGAGFRKFCTDTLGPWPLATDPEQPPASASGHAEAKS